MTSLLLTGRRADVLEETANEIRAASDVDVFAIPADMASYDDIKRMVAETAEGEPHESAYENTEETEAGQLA